MAYMSEEGYKKLVAELQYLEGVRRPEIIQQIAEEVGVFDNNYFVKLFRKNTGTTPSAYRKNYYIKEKKK